MGSGSPPRTLLRYACVAVGASLVGAAGTYAIAALSDRVTLAPWQIVAPFAALAALAAVVGADLEARRPTATVNLPLGAPLVIATTLLFALVFGAFLGEGETARPDRIHLPDAAVYAAVALAVFCTAFAAGRLMLAGGRSPWRGSGGALLLCVICGAVLSLGYGAGFGLVQGSPCGLYQHCFGLDESWWMVAERLAPLACLYGLGLGVVACCGVLVGQLPFLRRRPLALASRRAPRRGSCNTAAEVDV